MAHLISEALRWGTRILCTQRRGLDSSRFASPTSAPAASARTRWATRPYIWNRTNNPQERGSVKRLLDTWYRDHARSVFATCLSACLQSAKSLRLSDPCVQLRRMPTRWGSCDASGRIVLNTDLVKTPRYCIEYVIMHELCHLRVLDHGPQFYRLLARCMPDWEKRKTCLDAIVL